MTRLDDASQATAADTERLERWVLVECMKSIPSEAGRVTLYGGPVDALPAEKNPHVS
ncbi:hypothetical protein [Sorangium sp. So ce887]|uniref:hypothetical protein n=1 Tax=Sorangium sp. So ce887 TaxID=3133324 RepID=UPI003F648F86